MNRKRWQKIDPILDKVLQIDGPQKRKQYIREVCDDKELKIETLEILQCIEEANEIGFLE